MKLVTFEGAAGVRHIGALQADLKTISDFTASGAPHFAEMLALIEGGDRALDEARTLLERPVREVDLDTVRLLAPVPVPTQIFDCLCFEEHLLNSARNAHRVFNKPPSAMSEGGIAEVFRELPVYYKGNRFSVIGTGQDIICPRYCKFLDYELEFGVFISRRGKNWSVEEAADAIFGYTIFNDVSARDMQVSEMRGMLGPAKGKDFDTGNVMGPWLVTKDEVPVEKGLRMQAWINGDQVTDGNSRVMLHSFPEIIAHATRDETRQPGDFFGSGTVGGGCGMEHGRLLQDGDVLELEVEGLGRMINRVEFQPD